MELRGAAVVLTGASRGLGAALARQLGEAGARLVLVARDGEALSGVVEDVRRHGGEAHRHRRRRCAMRRRRRAIAGMTGALVGPTEIVVHNAGSLGPVPLAPLSDTDDAAFEHALATNLLAPFRLTRAVVGTHGAPRSRHRGAGQLGCGEHPVSRAGAPMACRRQRSSTSVESGKRSWPGPASGSSPWIQERWTPGCTGTRCPKQTPPLSPRPTWRRRGCCSSCGTCPMKHASRLPRPTHASGRDERLLHVDPRRRTLADARLDDLPELLRPGRPPGGERRGHPPGLAPRHRAGRAVELRLAGEEPDGAWRAVALRSGDWRTPTESRPPPPRARAG